MNFVPKFYKDRVVLNVLAGGLDNARALYDMTEGHVLLALLSKNYADDQSALVDMRAYQEAVNNAISIGLGAGDPNQSQMVSRLAAVLQPQHVNQVFTGAGHARMAVGSSRSFINALCSPTGKVGYLNIATGPLSRRQPITQVPVETVITLLKDMGADSLKFFNMRGLDYLDEYQAIAKACADMDFALEPTGGLDLANFEQILTVALEAGVKKIIPHVFGGIVDSATGETRIGDVKQLHQIVQRLVD